MHTLFVSNEIGAPNKTLVASWILARVRLRSVGVMGLQMRLQVVAALEQLPTLVTLTARVFRFGKPAFVPFLV